MSGDVPAGDLRVVDLSGTTMAALLDAIPVIEDQTGRSVILVGGLAVLCRLPSPYRVTVDLDTVDRQRVAERPQLELLVAAGATPSGPAGAVVSTASGPVQVDVLTVTDADLDTLPDDPTDRLHVLAHAWAATTATDLLLTADGAGWRRVSVAEPGALIAMKLQSIMNRGAAKEGTDLLDIARLSLDRECGPASRDQLEAADSQLRSDALLHVQRWFQEHAPRSLRKIRAVPEGRDVELEDLHLIAELLSATLI